MSDFNATAAVDFVIACALDGDERYERAAGRLAARIALDRGLDLAQLAIVLRCFEEHLPDNPEAARVSLLSWARLKPARPAVRR